MTLPPLLSIFVPTYNGARYVREAIESVLDNGFADLAIIVVDDGSTDETVKIVESIHHSAIRLSRNAKNLGVVETRRRGVSLLRGRYVALLDQDDIAVKGRFEAQVERLETAGGPDIVGGAIENFGDLNGVKTFFACDSEIRSALLFNASLAHPAVCMKVQPLRDGIIAYSVDAGAAADYALWVDAMLNGLRLENLDRVVTRYRRHATSMTRTNLDEMIACACLVRRRVAAAYFPNFSEAERAALVNAISRRGGVHYDTTMARRNFRVVACGAGCGCYSRNRLRTDGTFVVRACHAIDRRRAQAGGSGFCCTGNDDRDKFIFRTMARSW